MNILITIEGKPIPKGRPRFTNVGKYVRAYTDEKTFNYEKIVREKAVHAMKGEKPSENPIMLRMMFFIPIPKSFSKKNKEKAILGKIYPTTRPDLDNYIKIVDALNGICWIDDSQVIEISANKIYAELPRSEFVICDELPSLI